MRKPNLPDYKQFRSAKGSWLGSRGCCPVADPFLVVLVFLAAACVVGMMNCCGIGRVFGDCIVNITFLFCIIGCCCIVILFMGIVVLPPIVFIPLDMIPFVAADGDSIVVDCCIGNPLSPVLLFIIMLPLPVVLLLLFIV